MRKQDTSHWKKSPELENLLFASYRLHELVFNYTLDSYKHSTLNSNSLLREFKFTYVDIKSGKINNGAISSIIEEIRWSLERDIIVKEIIDLDLYLNSITTSNNINEVNATIDIIRNQIEGEYFKVLRRKISENIEQNGSKKELDLMLGYFVTDIIDQGINSNQLFHSIQNYFFNSNNAITEPKQIRHFIISLLRNSGEFEVVFKVSKEFEELKDSLESFGLELIDELPDNYSNEFTNGFLSGKTSNESFIICKKIEAKDPHSAREIVDKRIGTVSYLFTFYHHKSRLQWSEETIVRNIKKDFYMTLARPTPSILKCKDLKEEKASKNLKETVKNFSLKSDSFRRFDSAIGLHSLAIQSDAPQNQFINLWTALETLQPKKVDSGKDRIIQLSDTFTPFLSINYFEKLISSFTRSLLKWNYHEFKDLMSKIDEPNADDSISKMGAFLSLSKYDDERISLYSKLDDFPILRFRCFSLYQKFNSPKAVFDDLTIHEKRLKWHFDRLYRVRNSIVHDATVPKYLDTLVENLHSYLDIILDQIIKLRIQEEVVSKLDDAFQEVSLRYSKHKRTLEEYRKKEIDADNYETILFGHKKFVP